MSWAHFHEGDPTGEWVHPDGVECTRGRKADPYEALRTKSDPVQMPSHYTQLPVECIDVTEHFGFCLGNAIKYIWRADHKGKPVEDLEKAAWYIRREIERRKRSE